MIWWLLVSSLVLAQTLWNRRHWRLPASASPPEKVPTVSLLIPARNETHAITRALDNALALDYPKLEIIVLDDQSADNTSEKVRAFAQDGVRFLAGKPLPRDWVGKNWACAQLLEAASGDYLVFCDVDVVLNSIALTRSLRLMQQKQLSCLSLLPELVLPDKWSPILAPLQAWWMAALPLDRLKLPPVYGGFLMFNAHDLRRHGGWQRYPAHIMPELAMAADFTKQQRYHFLLNNQRLKLLLLKKPSSTAETRRRYLWPLYLEYPFFGLLHAALLSLGLLTLIWAPWAYLILVLSFSLAVRRQIRGWWLMALVLPLACLLELAALATSVLQRLRGIGAWKQRQLP